MNITVIIPVFNLVADRYKNFDYVVRKLLKTPSVKDIIIVEQKEKPSSILSTLFNEQKYRHFCHVTDNPEIEKTKMINYGVSLCKTEFYCMLDADIIFDFEKVFSQITRKDKAVQPFEYFLKLNDQQTANIFKDREEQIEGKHTHTIRCFSAGSYIMKKSFHKQIGGMNEGYMGWGWEDREFQDVVRNHTDIKIIDEVGYHLHHEPSKSKKGTSNYLLYYKHLKKNIDTAIIYVTENGVTESDIKALEYDLKQSLPVHRVWVELLFDKEKSKVKPLLKDKKIKVQHIIVKGTKKNKGLSQKEALINYAVGKLSKKYLYLVFKDTNAYVQDGDWYMSIRNQLTSGEKMIVNGGSKISYMDKSNESVQRETKTLWSSYRRGFPDDDFRCGVCTGMTRKMWELIGGLNPYGVMKYGDVLFALEAFPKSIHQKYKYLRDSRFVRSIIREFKVNVEFSGTDHNIIYCYDKEKPNFDVLYKFLNNIDVNLNDYIFLGEKGLLCWKKEFSLFEYLYENMIDIRNDNDLIKLMIASTLADYK
jgi:hypothetical protein